MGKPDAKNAWCASAQNAWRRALRAPVTLLATLAAVALFFLLVALPLPIGDRAATLLEASASCQLLLVLLLGLHATLSARAASRTTPLGPGGEASAHLAGRWIVAVAALLILASLQHIALQWLTDHDKPPTLARMLAHSLAAALVVLAWGLFLGRQLGSLPGALALLVLFLGASAWSETDRVLPSLAFLPDLALLSPVGHGTKGPPLPTLLGYALLQALFPLALAAVLAHLDAARGRRQRV